MDIFKLMRNSEEKEFEKKENFNEKEMMEAMKIFDAQRKALGALKDNEAFQSVIRFFELEKELCENYFKTGVKTSWLNNVQGRYQITCKFLEFIKARMQL